MQQIGRYQVLEEIARGGMGVVYKGYDPRANRVVAIKVLRRGGPGTETVRKRFEREARALARVRDPGVVRVYDFDATASGEPYMVMELIEGDSLQGRLNRGGALRLEEAVQVAAQLCGAVVACHAIGVLHRDLKPDNVLVARDGTLKLTDFGLTRDTELSTSRTQLTEEGKFLGSPGYWAPEQARGELDQIGVHTDVYGLGATLFALLTGQPPHSGSTPVEILSAVQEEKPAPSSLNPAVPAWLDEVVARALATDPADRFPSVGALILALESGGSGSSPGRKRPLLLVALAISLVGLSLALALIATSRQAPAAARDLDPQQQAEEAYAHGKACEERGDWQAAVEGYTEAIHLQPDYVEAWVNRGYARWKLGDVQGALEDYTEAIRLKPDHAPSYVVRGNLRGPRGALEDYAEAIRLQPDYALAYFNRGHTRTKLGESQRAIEDFGEAIRLRPDDADAYRDRGALREELGDAQGAVEDYAEAIRLRPDDALAYHNRGIARAVLDDLRAAIEDWNRALELSPDAPWAPDARQNLQVAGELLDERAKQALAAFERAEAGASSGDWQGAVADYTEAIRLQPDMSQAYCNRGVALGVLGDWPGSIEDSSVAIRLAPGSPDAYFNRGLSHASLRNWQAAIEDYSESIRLQPGHATGYYNRGVARAALGDLQGEIEDYGEAVRLDPDYVEAYVNRGVVRERLSDWGGAVADWERALELEPGASWSGWVRRDLEAAREQLARQEASQ